MRALIAIILLLLVVAGIFLAVRWRLRRFPHLRKRMIVGGVVVSVLGVLCAVWFPVLVPETPGSPATTVAIVLLWIAGGTLLALGVPALLAGVLTGRLVSEQTEKPLPPSPPP
jgi:hypothetical protein